MSETIPEAATNTAVELAPATRSLPAVLRDALAGDRLELLVGKVAAVPDRSHVTVDLQGGTITIPKLSSYSPAVNDACYILTDTPRILAIGTVTLAGGGATFPDLTVTGLTTTGSLQVNSNASVGGQVTCTGIQVNGGGNITADLVVAGWMIGGGLRTQANTLQATGTGLGFFGVAPVSQRTAAYTSDAALLSTRLWTALRDYGLIANV